MSINNLDKHTDNGFDTGYRKIEELNTWITEKEPGLDYNEADTRFKIIDKIFFECLQWPKNAVYMEVAHSGEYADYTFVAPRPILIVEAKREGNYFQIPAGKSDIFLKLSTLIRNNEGLKNAIKQATGYCQDRGIPLSVVSNGHQLVAFLAVRSDGVPPMDGDALVFASIDGMRDNFQKLWNFLSKFGVEEGHLYRALVSDSLPLIPSKLSSQIEGYPGTMNRNAFQAEMQALSSAVIADLPRAASSSTEFLKHCYCSTSQLSHYSLLSKTVLTARYSAMARTEIPHTPSLAVAGSTDVLGNEVSSRLLVRRPILIIGDVGVGKTTFLEHLMFVDAPELFQDTITLYIDLGMKGNLTDNLKTFIIRDIVMQLREKFHIDIDDDDIVREVYQEDLKRFSNGVNKKIKLINPEKFIEKEVEYLEGLISDKEAHVSDSMRFLAEIRMKKIVVLIDNADQQDYDTQQKAFLIAQELAMNWPASVFLTLRPETFYQSLKRGALTAYHVKAFTISPPSTDSVILKRLNYAQKLLKGELPMKSGIHLKADSLLYLTHAFLDSMKSHKELPTCIENVSNGNLRQALEMVESFFGSGHVNTEKICRIYEETGRYTIPVHEFIRAIIFGDARHYDPEQSRIVNLFDIRSLDGKEHFLMPLLLGSLQTLDISTNEGNFVSAQDVYSHLQAIGYLPEQIDRAFVRAVRTRLVETTQQGIPEQGEPIRGAFRPTSLGIYHVKNLVTEFSYVDAMIEDTPILDDQIRERNREVYSIIDRIERVELFLQYLDSQWVYVNSKNAISSFNWGLCSVKIFENCANVRLKAGKSIIKEGKRKSEERG